MPKIEMYSSRFCPFCWGATRLLNAKGVEFITYIVDGDPQKRREMIDRGGGHTVPQVFVDGRPVGGFDELTALDIDQQLDPLLGVSSRPSA